MNGGSSSSVRRFLKRGNSKSSLATHGFTSGPVIRLPDLLAERPDTLEVTASARRSCESFIHGVDLLRVTRRKARTRTFSIDPDAGTVSLDGVPKFTVQAIRDLRTGDSASHYRELCRISAEHEPRWLSIVYYQEVQKLKVLHVICPSVELLQEFRDILLNLYQRWSRITGTSVSLFGHGHTSFDEEVWYSLMSPKIGSNADALLHESHSSVSSSAALCDSVKPSLTLDQIELLCHKLHFMASSAHLARLFREVDTDDTESLDFPAFKKFVDLLKIRQDIVDIYNLHKSSEHAEMSRVEFVKFLREVQGCQETDETLHKVFDRAREPASYDKKESISTANFTSYILSHRNSLLCAISSDMSRPLHEYYISSSHNTYLTGRQVGDESSIEPYIRALQKGCRCIEIDIWSNSDGFPEVRHGRAFTTAVSLESVLKAIDKYAFIVSPWPLIISLEVRCTTKAQLIIVEMLIKIFGDVLVCSKGNRQSLVMPSPEQLRHRILLKIKASDPLSDSLQFLDHSLYMSKEVPIDRNLSGLEDGVHSSSSVSASAADSDVEFEFRNSRASSMSSRSSSYSNPASTSYRPFSRPAYITEDLSSMAPYLRGIKFRNFSLPESKTFNHIFSLSERTLKKFPRETNVQLQKHNTRYLMRMYPSPSRLMSTNFVPQRYWQQGIQMVAMNWQTHDLGMRMNEAFFATEGHSDDTSGYLLKPPHLISWEKGQDATPRVWTREMWTIEIISGSQLSSSTTTPSKISPFVEVDLYRPMTSGHFTSTETAMPGSKVVEKDRVSKYKSVTIEDNGFNPRFNSMISFVRYEDEDPFFTFLSFRVKNAVSGEQLGQCLVPLQRIQQGYRIVELQDTAGERFVFSSLLIKVTSRHVTCRSD